VSRIRQRPGVSDVRYDRQWLDRLAAVVAVIRGMGLLLGSVPTVVAGLTVANVGRLALYARRDEVSIMQLVGAPHNFIRGPFLMEGVLQGGAGSLVALAGLVGGYLLLRGRYLPPFGAVIDQASIHYLPAQLCLLLVCGRMAVGCLGGIVAVWKAA